MLRAAGRRRYYEGREPCWGLSWCSMLRASRQELSLWVVMRPRRRDLEDRLPPLGVRKRRPRRLRSRTLYGNLDWRYRNPFVSLMLVLIGVPVGVGIALLAEGPSIGRVGVIAALFLAWVILFYCARALDSKIMPRDARPKRTLLHRRR